LYKSFHFLFEIGKKLTVKTAIFLFSCCFFGGPVKDGKHIIFSAWWIQIHSIIIIPHLSLRVTTTEHHPSKSLSGARPLWSGGLSGSWRWRYNTHARRFPWPTLRDSDHSFQGGLVWAVGFVATEVTMCPCHSWASPVTTLRENLMIMCNTVIGPTEFLSGFRSQTIQFHSYLPVSWPTWTWRWSSRRRFSANFRLMWCIAGFRGLRWGKCLQGPRFCSNRGQFRGRSCARLHPCATC